MTTKCTDRTGPSRSSRQRVVEAHARSTRDGAPSTRTDRTDRIEALRREIADGTYETDARLDITARRLLRDLLSRG